MFQPKTTMDNLKETFKAESNNELEELWRRKNQAFWRQWKNNPSHIQQILRQVNTVIDAT